MVESGGDGLEDYARRRGLDGITVSMVAGQALVLGLGWRWMGD